MTRRVSVPALVVLGLTLLGVAGAFSSVSYWRALLINLGTGVLLFAVLNLVLAVVLQRVETVEQRTEQSVSRLTDEVEQVQRAVTATQARLDIVGDETRQLLRREYEADREALQRFEEDVTLETTLRLLERAQRLKAIDPGGIRVRIPGTRTGLWLRFTTGDMQTTETVGLVPAIAGIVARATTSDLVWIQIEDAYGQIQETMAWSADKSIAEMMAEVAKTLQQMGEYPGERAFDPTIILKQLKNTLSVVIAARTAQSDVPSDLGPVVEIPNDQWAVTSDGIQSLNIHDYFIHKKRLGGTWPGHMLTKRWVDIEKFEEAFYAAQGIYHDEFEAGSDDPD